MRKAAAYALAVCLVSAWSARAQQASGSLMATAIVQGSVGLSVQSAAAGDPLAVSVAPTAGTFTIPVTVDVIRANTTAAAVVTMRLENAESDGTVWTIDGQSLNDAATASVGVSASAKSTLTLLVRVTSRAHVANPPANRIVFEARID